MTEIVTVLNSIGYVQLSDMGTEWRTNPLYREYRSQNALSINKRTGRWFDHSERCGGSLAQLVQKTLQLASVEETRAYMGDLPISIDTRESVELSEVKKFDKVLLTKLLKDNSYWHSRGISDRILEPFRGGIAQNGRMKDRFVFPVFDDRDDLIGFAGRLLYQSDTQPKWKILNPKKNFIFPLLSRPSIIKKKSIIIVESIGDLLSCYEVGFTNVYVLFGVSLGENLICEFLKNDPKNIFIVLNNDENSGFIGNSAAIDIRNDILSHFDSDQVHLVTPPWKDLNEGLMADSASLKDFLSKMELHV